MADQTQVRTITQGDAVDITFQYQDATVDPAVAIDITGYTLAMHVERPKSFGGGALEKAGTITNAAAGLAKFSFGNDEITFHGVCKVQFKLTDDASKTRRFGGMALNIVPKLR